MTVKNQICFAAKVSIALGLISAVLLTSSTAVSIWLPDNANLIAGLWSTALALSFCFCGSLYMHRSYANARDIKSSEENMIIGPDGGLRVRVSEATLEGISPRIEGVSRMPLGALSPRRMPGMDV